MAFYESVVFEIDSVLIDTFPALRAFYTANNKMSGKSAEEAFRACLMRQNTASPWDKSFAARHGLIFIPTVILTDKIISDCHPYKHVVSLLESIKKGGLSVGAISSLPAPLISEVLKNANLTYDFNVLICDDIDIPRSKDELLADCFGSLGTAADRSAFIGAFPSSALAAWKNMTSFFASAYGFGFKNWSDAQRFSPSYTAVSPDDFIKLEKHSVLLS